MAAEIIVTQEEQDAFLVAIQDPDKRTEIISILREAGLLPV